MEKIDALHELHLRLLTESGKDAHHDENPSDSTDGQTEDRPEPSKDDIPNELDEFIYDGDRGIARLCVKVAEGSMKAISANGEGYYFHRVAKHWKLESGTLSRIHVARVLIPFLENSMDFSRDRIGILRAQMLLSGRQEAAKEEVRLKQLERVRRRLNGYGSLGGIFKYVIPDILDPSFEFVMNTADPDSLPIQGGRLISLRTGEIRDRRKSDLFSFECPVNYLGHDHPCPNATRFFDQVFINDREMIEFALQLFGYFMTGHTNDRSFYFLWGTAHNGKSALVEIMGKILGDFYTPTTVELFMKQSRDVNPHNATPALMSLKGRRLCSGSEAEACQRLDENMIKRLTGDDSVTGRGLFQKQKTFRMFAKLLITTNELPIYRSYVSAMKERVKLIPFLASFVQRDQRDFNDPRQFERDWQFVEDLRTIHLDEVFTLLVRGAMRWYANDMKLHYPTICNTVLGQQNVQNDHLGRFIDECCELSDQFRTPTGAFHRACQAWYISEGLEPESAGRLGAQMRAKNIRVKNSNGNRYCGIRLIKGATEPSLPDQ